MGWFTVASYFLCALVVWFLSAGCKEKDEKASSFWFMVGIVMVLLGINKQLDLQSLFTEIGRQIAKAQGWMDQRRIVQAFFIGIVGIGAALFFYWISVRARDLFGRFRLAFVGLFFLLSFIVIRAASFHHFDEVIRFRFHGAKMNWLFELTGIYLVMIAGLKEIILPLRKRD